jgi:hypothetical protein
MLNESSGMVEFDLDKYALSHLRDADPTEWSDSDVEKIMEAFFIENIAPTFSGPFFTPGNIVSLLGTSHCRRCGKCCLPNPLDPKNPGVMVFKKDLELIAEHSDYSYEDLIGKAIPSTDPQIPPCWYLPLPCMFYDKENRKCSIYETRPFVCKVTPMPPLMSLGTDKPVGILVSVGCEYGKDIFRNLTCLAKKSSSSISDVFTPRQT